MVMDQAWWHIADDLIVPQNVFLVLLPSYSPKLNPVERVWLYLRERYLSHGLLNTYDDIVDALCSPGRQPQIYDESEPGKPRVDIQAFAG